MTRTIFKDRRGCDSVCCNSGHLLYGMSVEGLGSSLHRRRVPASIIRSVAVKSKSTAQEYQMDGTLH